MCPTPNPASLLSSGPQSQLSTSRRLLLAPSCTAELVHLHAGLLPAAFPQRCLLAHPGWQPPGGSDSSFSLLPVIHQGPLFCLGNVLHIIPLFTSHLYHRHVASCGSQGPSSAASLPSPSSLTVLLSPCGLAVSRARSWHLSSMPVPMTRCLLWVLCENPRLRESKHFSYL